jgi:hypothetical protein
VALTIALEEKDIIVNFDAPPEPSAMAVEEASEPDSLKSKKPIERSHGRHTIPQADQKRIRLLHIHSRRLSVGN